MELLHSTLRLVTAFTEAARKPAAVARPRTVRPPTVAVATLPVPTVRVVTKTTTKTVTVATRKKSTVKTTRKKPTPPIQSTGTANVAAVQPVRSRRVKPKREKQRIPTAIRNEVWVVYHGEYDVGVCYCCNVAINRYEGWHCSHVHPEVKGGEISVENLRTCCQHCNLSMGDQYLYTYIRDRGLTGPGAEFVDEVLLEHPSQVDDKRTNRGWARKGRRRPTRPVEPGTARIGGKTIKLRAQPVAPLPIPKLNS